MRNAPISAALTVLLAAAWYIVALALALTTWFAAVSTFHDFGGTSEIDIPVSLAVDARALRVSAPSLGVEMAHLHDVRGSLTFPPPTGVSLVTPALVALALILAAVLWVLSQLRAVFRTVRDGQPFVRANAVRIWRIGFVVIVAEFVRAAIIFSANSYAMTHFSANGLQFDAPPDVNIFTIIHGLIIVAIAEVFRAGTRLDEDQSLTI